MTDHRTAAEALLRRSEAMSAGTPAAAVYAAQATAHALLAQEPARPLVIAVSSDLDAEQAKALIDDLNARLAPVPAPEAEEVPDLMGALVESIDRAKTTRKRAARKPRTSPSKPDSKETTS